MNNKNNLVCVADAAAVVVVRVVCARVSNLFVCVCVCVCVHILCNTIIYRVPFIHPIPTIFCLYGPTNGRWFVSPPRLFFYKGTAGESVNRTPNLFFSVTLCLEYLSSGEKRAGCAEMVGAPEGSVFSSVYTRLLAASR